MMGYDDTIKAVRLHKDDNGSPAVQVVRLTQQIESVVTHLKKNPKDHSARRGLVKMVGKRRVLLSFLQRTDPDRYVTILFALGI